MPGACRSPARRLERHGPARTRFARLEQLGWLSSAEAWNTLRQIRNQFAHDHPYNPAQRFERLQVAIEAADQLLTLMSHISPKLSQRFA